jgi:hypothetical protein
LRHTVAVILRECGYDERIIAGALGQKTIEMARLYVRHQPEPGSQSGTRSRTTPRCAGQAKRVINKQSKTVERMRHARQHFGRLVGKQARRRRVTGRAINRRMAASQIRCRPVGLGIQRAGSQCPRGDRSSCGRLCRMAAASCRAASRGGRTR